VEIDLEKFLQVVLEASGDQDGRVAVGALLILSTDHKFFPTNQALSMNQLKGLNYISYHIT